MVTGRARPVPLSRVSQDSDELFTMATGVTYAVGDLTGRRVAFLRGQQLFGGAEPEPLRRGGIAEIRHPGTKEMLGCGVIPGVTGLITIRLES